MKKIIMLVLPLLVISCTSLKKEECHSKETQNYTAHSPTAHQEAALEVLSASKQWIENFNNGNAEECANAYTSNSVMRAMPFGVKKSKDEILEFWTSLISSGANNLVYTDVSVEVVDEQTAMLSANWSMNIGEGIIYQEKWVKENGKWVLSYDDFEVLLQYESPLTNEANPIASHERLDAVLSASISWTTSFNSGDAASCGEGYVSNASMNAVPFASLHSKDEITSFWEKLVSDGATNLTYHNLTISDVSPNSILLSSNWSMNIGEGKIYQEKWVNSEGDWKLNYDEFQVLKQY
jgi:ketosteroid isomerase-like protein